MHLAIFEVNSDWYVWLRQQIQWQIVSYMHYNKNNTQDL